MALVAKGAKKPTSNFRPVLLPLLTIPIALRLTAIVRRRTDGPSLNEALAGTGMLQLAFCVLLSAGVLLS